MIKSDTVMKKLEERHKPEEATERSVSELNALLERFDAISANTYHQYIGLCGADECLGWEAKVDCREFGNKELQAHKDAQEMLGRHRAFAEAAKMIREETDEEVSVERESLISALNGG